MSGYELIWAKGEVEAVVGGTVGEGVVLEWMPETWEWEEREEVVVARCVDEGQLAQALQVMVDWMILQLEGRLGKGLELMKTCSDEDMGKRLMEQWGVLMARYRVLLENRALLAAAMEEVDG